MQKKVVAIEFDGPIHAFSKGWHDGSIYDGPTPGAIEAIDNFIKEGHEVTIISVRLLSRMIEGRRHANQIREIGNWLDEHGFNRNIKLHTDFGKPLAWIHIDPRAFRWDDWANDEHFIRGYLEIDPI